MPSTTKTPATELSGIDRFWGITAAGSNVRTEIRAGVTTFLTMSYILFVNPSVLSSAIPVPNAFTQLLMVTALAACFGSLVMGVIARFPFAQAPGMGLNAFFAYTVVLGSGYHWRTALGAVFVSGVLFVVLSLLGARQAIVRAIPLSLKLAITAGIGCFLAFLGLKSAGLVVGNEATLLGLGSMTSASAWVALLGLIVSAVLLSRKVTGAILWGILIASLAALLSRAEVYTGADGTLGPFAGFGAGIVALPVWPGDLVGQLDIGAALGLGVFSVVFTFFFVDFFDATGTLTGLAQRSGYLDEKGDMPRARTVFAMDGLAAIVGAVLGTSTTTAYVESASGIEEGGRTGLTATTVAVLFALSTFLWPLAAIVPAAATAPALILVGAMMMTGIRQIEWGEIGEAVPAFLTIIVMPLTFSIANGVSLGIIGYCLVNGLGGRATKVHPILYGLAALLVARYIFLGEA